MAGPSGYFVTPIKMSTTVVPIVIDVKTSWRQIPLSCVLEGALNTDKSSYTFNANRQKYVFPCSLLGFTFAPQTNNAAAAFAVSQYAYFKGAGPGPSDRGPMPHANFVSYTVRPIPPTPVGMAASVDELKECLQATRKVYKGFEHPLLYKEFIADVLAGFIKEIPHITSAGRREIPKFLWKLHRLNMNLRLATFPALVGHIVSTVSGVVPNEAAILQAMISAKATRTWFKNHALAVKEIRTLDGSEASDQEAIINEWTDSILNDQLLKHVDEKATTVRALVVGYVDVGMKEGHHDLISLSRFVDQSVGAIFLAYDNMEAQINTLKQEVALRTSRQDEMVNELVNRDAELNQLRLKIVSLEEKIASLQVDAHLNTRPLGLLGWFKQKTATAFSKLSNAKNTVLSWFKSS